MEKMICPYCEKDLTENASKKIARGEAIANCTFAGYVPAISLNGNSPHQ